MTESEQKTVIKELCNRLPYRVIVQIKWDDKNPKEVKGLEYLTNPDNMLIKIGNSSGIPVEHVKPYLRRLTSMTTEEETYYNDVFPTLSEKEKEEWILSRHFDTDMIDKDLALEATVDMYK